MAKKTEKIKKRLIEVFTIWIEQSDDYEIKEIQEQLNDWLDEWHRDDRFGTEGQCDPRGDARDLPSIPKI